MAAARINAPAEIHGAIHVDLISSEWTGDEKLFRASVNTESAPVVVRLSRAENVRAVSIVQEEEEEDISGVAL